MLGRDLLSSSTVVRGGLNCANVPAPVAKYVSARCRPRRKHAARQEPAEGARRRRPRRAPPHTEAPVRRAAPSPASILLVIVVAVGLAVGGATTAPKVRGLSSTTVARQAMRRPQGGAAEGRAGHAAHARPAPTKLTTRDFRSAPGRRAEERKGDGQHVGVACSTGKIFVRRTQPSLSRPI